jgi:DNA-binding transcriptional MerR regulator
MGSDRRPDLISIGRFARLSRLTPRQLRYYHALGLLLPATVDPDSGYRYYASTQQALAELIALLRSVDMPVSEIQSLLSDRSPANIRAVFDRLRLRIEERLTHAQDILDRLDTLTLEDAVMEQKSPATYPYVAFTEESREVLKLAQQLAEDAGHHYIGSEHLLAALASEQAGEAGAALRRLGIETRAVMDVASAIHRETGPQEPVQGPLVPIAAMRELIGGAFAGAGYEPATTAEQVIGTVELLRSTVRERPDEKVGAAAALQRLGVTPSHVLASLPS